MERRKTQAMASHSAIFLLLSIFTWDQETAGAGVCANAQSGSYPAFRCKQPGGVPHLRAYQGVQGL